MSSQNFGLSTGRATGSNSGSSGAAAGVGSIVLNGIGSGAAAPRMAAGHEGGGSPGDTYNELGGAGADRAQPLTEQDLPPPDTKRWVMRRKAEVVAAVRCGVISLDEACRRYTLSVEEFLSWQRLIDSHGVRGLRATRLQDYRSGSSGGNGGMAD